MFKNPFNRSKSAYRLISSTYISVSVFQLFLSRNMHNILSMYVNLCQCVFAGTSVCGSTLKCDYAFVYMCVCQSVCVCV